MGLGFIGRVLVWGSLAWGVETLRYALGQWHGYGFGFITGCWFRVHWGVETLGWALGPAAWGLIFHPSF